MLFSVNRGFVNKTAEDKKRYSIGYEDIYGDVDTLKGFILDGHAFSASYAGGKRSKGDFLHSEIVALDFDGNTKEHEVEHLVNSRPFVKNFASFAYTTASHTEQEPRCRAVFVLAEPVTTVDEYESIVGEMLKLFPDADQACKDASRLFYGNTNAKIVDIGRTLDKQTVDKLLERASKSNQPASKESGNVEIKVIADGDAVSSYVSRSVSDQMSILSRCQEGGRHNELLVSSLKMFSFVKSPWTNGILSKENAESMLIDAATANGLVHDEGIDKVIRTMSDAYEMSSQREMPNLRLSTRVQINNYTADDMQKAYVLGMYRAMSDQWRTTLFSVIPREYAEMHTMSMSESGLTIPYWTDKRRAELSNIQHGLNDPQFEVEGFPVMNIELEQSYERCIVVGSVNGAVSIGHHCKGLDWDVLACPKIDQLPYIGEVLFNYDKIVFVSSDRAPITEGNHYGLSGARYLQLQVEPEEMFRRWGVDEKYFDGLIKTSWV